MEIGNPFAIDQSWVVSNISLNVHGSDKQKVTVRLWSEALKAAIRQQMPLEQYEAQFKDSWRLGRRITMYMVWQDEVGVGPQQGQQQQQPADLAQLVQQQVGMGGGMNLGRPNPTPQAGQQ